ncbi:MAG: hypothetical protein A2015_03050 [Spirochaetes bacterium GWF1_31_7]|nr:MAG: hypothetical protein A2Y30_16510 [Spirochaetes bacterium GWE1_32_154]OHD45314.1 MAG: hypothetical protein A2Y29_08290 [Spirochaetes bacterium GWE2_31_10]OHD50946.1 MAG: hypothetical protein A2015_03050 [Spirochaetes bacterium GWF1_31_7]HBD95591.1 hypothetical protein [Spirochaetia bacterium]HBI37281.1 hypothetical protein [Spirochaetia bacterium]
MELQVNVSLKNVQFSFKSLTEHDGFSRISKIKKFQNVHILSASLLNWIGFFFVLSILLFLIGYVLYAISLKYTMIIKDFLSFDIIMWGLLVFIIILFLGLISMILEIWDSLYNALYFSRCSKEGYNPYGLALLEEGLYLRESWNSFTFIPRERVIDAYTSTHASSGGNAPLNRLFIGYIDGEKECSIQTTIFDYTDFGHIIKGINNWTKK